MAHNDTIDIGTGVIYNIPTALNIRQSGLPDIHVTTDYSSKPFTDPPYYLIRYGHWWENAGFEIEFIHHKLYLDNPPHEVQTFTITNGYNLLLINRSYRRPLAHNNQWLYRFGAGIVITHPESIIRGHKFNEHGGIRWFDTDGYYISGGALQAAIQFVHYVGRHFSIFGEGKLTAAYATVPVWGGHADAPNLATHLLAGISYTF